MNRPKEITKNIVSIGDLYDIGTATWWLNHDKLPSTMSIRNFSVNISEWESWVKENVSVESFEYKQRNAEKNLSLKSCVGYLKEFRSVLIHWNTSHISKEIMEISNLSFKFSHEYETRFTTEWVDKSLDPLKIIEDSKSKIYMVIQNRGGLDLQEFDIHVPEINVEMNYGNEWNDKHEKLKEILSLKKKKGIALLHGLPGTGKSMYIRHLIASMSENKTVIYLPNQLIPSITDPGFIPLMAEYAGSILIIEDADEAIKARKNGGRTVDKLLNLADGILSDFLNMQIICTFNSDIATIDEALLRKGRLILKHKFDKLSIEQAQKLSNHLGFIREIKNPMTLAEIYNQEDTLSEIKNDENPKIGFMR